MGRGFGQGRAAGRGVLPDGRTRLQEWRLTQLSEVHYLRMNVTWLHVSDFHIRSGDPYDRDVVLRALTKSVKDFRDPGRRPHLIFATGDIAYSGKAAEYERPRSSLTT